MVSHAWWLFWLCDLLADDCSSEEFERSMTMVYVAFILYETLMFRESGDARTNFVLFSYAGKFLKEQSVRVGLSITSGCSFHLERDCIGGIKRSGCY